MRISDWSSDVCSSDLIPGGDPERNKRLLRERRADAQMHALPSALPNEAGKFDRAAQSALVGFTPKSVIVSNDSPITPTTTAQERQPIGRASYRERVCTSLEVSGVAVSSQKKKQSK